MKLNTTKNKQKPTVLSRRFLGKTENFENSIERNFYQRMLRAYLKGKQYFYFGFFDMPAGNGITFIRPKLIKVAQEYYQKEI